jgi:PIN domain nuclease of toxin-antitoxin system
VVLGEFNVATAGKSTCAQQAERGEALTYVPVVVLWEVSRLEKEGEIKLKESYEDWTVALPRRFRVTNTSQAKPHPPPHVSPFFSMAS